jgi:hypothetical protein
LVLAVIFCQVLCLSADGEFNENVDLEDILGESKELLRPHDRWIEDYQQHSLWTRPRSRRKKNKKSKIGHLHKRLQQNQHRRRMHTSRNDFHSADDKDFDRMADFVSNQRHRDEETSKRTMLDPQRIRIRIRLRQRGPVKRHAKQGKKKTKKVLTKLAQKLATQEAMAMVLKNFLRDDKKAKGFSSRHKAIMRKSAKGHRRIGQFALRRKGRRGMKARLKKRKN